MSKGAGENKEDKMNVAVLAESKKSLNFHCRTVARCMDNIANNIFKIGNSLYHIKSDELFAIEGYKDIYSFAMDKFGISRSTCSKYIGVREYFGLDSQYSASQMMEMLPWIRKGYGIDSITPDMTVKQIRQFMKDNYGSSISDVETAIEDNAGIPDVKPEKFIFCVTDELMRGSSDAVNAFYSDIRTAVANAFNKYGAHSVKIIIEK